MINSSPITTWEGAGVFMTCGADTFGTHLWFWIAVICCLIPIFVLIKAENATEKKHS